MDQVKIGRFIAALRKERGLTQLQLAERLGVSDKTVSKWECGKGMPEISALVPLCGALSVNVNELLSGERLSVDNYSQKAEENMMHLMRQSEDSKKRSKNIGLGMALALAAVCAVIVLAVAMGGGGFLYLLDMPSILLLAAATTLILLAAGLWKDFFRALGFVFGKKDFPSQQAGLRARAAVKLAARAMLYAGILVGVLSFVMIFISVDTHEAELKSSAVALIAPLYGLISYYLLLPVRSRLDIRLKCAVSSAAEQKEV